MVSLEEQLLLNSFEKVFMGAAGGGATLDITDVFSTYLHTGNSASQPINNGIDLSGEGGLVWIKWRSGNNAFGHSLHDTERGVTKELHSDSTPAQSTEDRISSFNSTGFSLTNNTETNLNANYYVSWTFRKAPKFFDVVTYTGSGSAKTVAHSLGSAPGMIIIKNTSVADPWAVYHRANTAAPQTDYLVLNTSAATVDSAAWWNDTAPTSSVFTVGTDHSVNANGENYIAYIFAHNDSGDGEFGPDADQDIIKCGSYVSHETSPPEITLGFEPQWILIKKSTGVDEWALFDNMRGVPTGGNDAMLRADLSSVEYDAANQIDFTSTGFKLTTAGLGVTNAPTGETYIYMAIRRGPLAPPEAGTEVFAMDMDGGTNNHLTSGFPVDLGVYKSKLNTYNWSFNDRLRGAFTLKSNSTAAEASNTAAVFDNNTGWGNSSGFTSEYPSWMWKRAPSFFDVVAYTGDGTSGSYAHNLGVVPELKIIKNRNSSGGWTVGGSGVTGGTTAGYLVLSTTAAKAATSGEAYWGSVDSDTTFSVRAGNSGSNMSGRTYIAYLFATLAGVSKVGSVTHSGTTNVDCGFSAGARFVLLKRTDATGDWYLWDSVRGIIAGNDPYLLFNSTAVEVTNTDYIDPLSSGFTISDAFTDGDYIFYAIA